MTRFTVIVAFVLVPCASFVGADAHGADENSNLWPVHSDEQLQFRVSYPPEWLVIPPKGRSIRLSVSPPDGAATCNVMARPAKELEGMSQSALNQGIETSPLIGLHGRSTLVCPFQRLCLLKVAAPKSKAFALSS